MGYKGHRAKVCKKCSSANLISGRAVCSQCYADSRKETRPASLLKQRYGLTSDQYDNLLKSQDYKCAICETPEISRHQNGQVKRLAVDHIHATGHIRGLLCKACNQAIGLLKDNSETILKAASYVATRGT